MARTERGTSLVRFEQVAISQPQKGCPRHSSNIFCCNIYVQVVEGCFFVAAGRSAVVVLRYVCGGRRQLRLRMFQDLQRRHLRSRLLPARSVATSSRVGVDVSPHHCVTLAPQERLRQAVHGGRGERSSRLSCQAPLREVSDEFNPEQSNIQTPTPLNMHFLVSVFSNGCSTSSTTK